MTQTVCFDVIDFTVSDEINERYLLIADYNNIFIFDITNFSLHSTYSSQLYLLSPLIQLITLIPTIFFSKRRSEKRLFHL